MNIRSRMSGVFLLAAVSCSSAVMSTQASAADFGLIRAVPDDVFLVVAAKHNPEQAFLDEYWGEVCKTLKETGVGEDLMALIGSQIGENEMNEVNRLKDKAQRLIDGVNWGDLKTQDFVFAERMAAPDIDGSNISMGPPDFICMFRGGKAAEKNYTGLVAILQGMVEEINTARGSQQLKIAKSDDKGAKIASCNFTASVPGAPPITLSVSQRDDVIIISFGERLLRQSLALLAGDKSAKSIAANARFKSAFSDLAAAEDQLVFFDMQRMLKPVRRIVSAALGGQTDAAQREKLQGFSDRMFDLPGLIDYTATTIRTEGHSVYSDVRVALVKDAKSKPFYAVFGGKMSVTAASEFARYLPKETVSYEVISPIDFVAFSQFVEDSFKAYGDEGAMLWSKWEEFQVTAKFDVKKEVFSLLNGTSTNVMLEGGGWVGMMNVTDPEFAKAQLDRGMEFLSTQMTAAAKQNPMFGMMAIRRVPVKHETLAGFETIYTAMNPMPAAVWGVTDGKLMFGSSIDAIEMCINTAKGTHPGMKKNARLMAEAIVPDKDFFSATLRDQRNMGKELQAIIGVVSFASGLMPMAIPDPEVRSILGKVAGMIAKLSPVAGKIDFFKSTSTCTTFDGQNFWTKQVTHYASPEERKVANAS